VEAFSPFPSGDEAEDEHGKNKRKCCSCISGQIESDENEEQQDGKSPGLRDQRDAWLSEENKQGTHQQNQKIRGNNDQDGNNKEAQNNVLRR